MTDKTKEKPKVIAYIRVSTDKQDVNNQKFVINAYAKSKGLEIMEEDFIQIQISATKTRKQRKIDEVLAKLRSGDTLIVTELSRLGRSIPEIMGLVHEILEMDVRLIMIKENLDISKQNKYDITSKVMVTVFSLLAELDRHLISLRTKEAMATRKANGKILGKPRGIIQKSKFDKDATKIELLLVHGVTGNEIARQLGHYPASLNKYIKVRGLRPKREDRYAA